MARKPTIQDVAILAGVSVATADRVLNRRGGVKPDKEQRVLSAARRLKIDRRLEGGYGHRLRVAVLIQTAENPFHAALGHAFVAANRTYQDVSLQFLVHRIDPNRPERIAATIERLGRQHDGLIATCPDAPIVTAALRRAARRIPVATLATDIPDCGRHAYVGPDDEQAGRVAGELMGRFLGARGGAVLMIAGLLSLAGHRARATGFRAVLGEHYPACRVMAVAESREEPERAGEIVAATLRTHPDLVGVYLTSAGAEAVAAVLKAAGKAEAVFITHELTDDRRDLLRRRALHAVVDQDPSSEVEAVAETMARLLGRVDGVSGSRLTPVRIYTAENC